MQFVVVLLISGISLGAWAVCNILVSLRQKKSQPKGSIGYFKWQLNGYWNIVNLLIALLIPLLILYNYNRLRVDFDYRASIAIFYMFSVLFDLLIVALGIFLKTERSKKLSSKRIGYGQAIVIQGVFLLTLDIISFLALSLTF